MQYCVTLQHDYSVFQFCHSAGLYIKYERSKKTLYSFKTYLETVIQEGAQDRVEEDELKRGQGPYSHTRKKAVSMTAKLMVSNDPNLRKVRAINFPDINIDPVINRQTTWVSCILGKLNGSCSCIQTIVLCQPSAIHVPQLNQFFIYYNGAVHWNSERSLNSRYDHFQTNTGSLPLH